MRLADGAEAIGRNDHAFVPRSCGPEPAQETVMVVPGESSLSRTLLRVLPALVAIAAMVPAAFAVGGTGPEGDPLLPDLDQETPSGLVLTKGASGWRLGFGSAVRSVGDGPLIIDGRRPDPAARTMSANQVLVRVGGPRTVVPAVGRLRYVRSPDHRHWHLPAKPPEPRYTSRCGIDRPGLFGIREGISVGYGDNYVANLEGQYLPLAGLRPGRYVLVHVANADHRLVEPSYHNNAASVLLSLRRGGMPRLRILALCATSEQCSA